MELALFTRDDLNRHIAKGDETFPGHPSCGFCQINFYSKDELFTHCREKHEECFICRQNGVKDEFFRDYTDLVNITLLASLMYMYHVHVGASF